MVIFLVTACSRLLLFFKGIVFYSESPRTAPNKKETNTGGYSIPATYWCHFANRPQPAYRCRDTKQ